ncbi:MAG: helix-turn-helix domain-containing protein [Candidatus Thorarchaeota archaeon]
MVSKSYFERAPTNANDRVIFECLATENRAMTRDEIAYLTGVPRTTTFDSLQRLILKKIVEVESEGRITVGRPKRFYTAIIHFSDQGTEHFPTKIEQEMLQRS